MATYTAASVALSVVPDLTGFFAELDQRLRGYSPPPIPGPDIEPDVDTDAAEDEIEQSASSGGLATAAVAAGALLGAALGAAIGKSMELSGVQSRLKAQLGDHRLIGAERAGQIAGNLYAGAWGDSMGEVADAVSNVIRSGAVAATATDEEIQGVTASILDLAGAFDVDTVRATEALSAMVRNNLVPNAQAGLDVITRLYQTLGPGADDVLDTFQEYSLHFQKIGIDADLAGGIIVQMFRAGARDTDIAADAIKEFAIRSIDGSKLTVEAYEGIGVSADEMRRRISAGGPDAQAAMSEVVAALKSVEDPALRAEYATGLFGTQAEDLGDALFAMDPQNAVDSMDKIEGAATEMGTALNDNATTKFTEFRRVLETGVTDFVTAQVLPIINSLLDVMLEFGKLPGVPDFLAFLFSAGAGMAVTIGLVVGAIKLWSGAQLLLNAVMAANPIMLVVAVIGALIGAAIWAYHNVEWFRDGVDRAFAWIGEAAGRLGAAWDKTMKSFGDIATWVFDYVLKPAFDGFNSFLDGTVKGFQIIWDGIKKVFGTPVYFVLETVWNQGIGGLWQGAKNLGIPLGEFPRANTDGIPRFAEGGPVRGRRGRKDADDVPAWLTADEYVQPRDAVDFYGADTMDAIRRRAIPRDPLRALQSGEVLDGADHDGPGARRSGFGGVRPHVAMAGHHLMRKYGIGSVGGVGRRPNVSDHPLGLALDFMTRGQNGTQLANEVIARRAHYATKYAIWRQRINKGSGWTRMADRGGDTANHFDHVHVSFHGRPGDAIGLGAGSIGGDFSGSGSAQTVTWFEDLLRGAFDGLAGTARALVESVAPRRGHFLGDLPMDTTDWAIGKARDLLFGKAKEADAASMADSVGGNVARWTGVVQQALGMLGQSSSLVGSTLRRMNQESGGNPNAVNLWDSNAKRGTPSVGLLQVIRGTYAAHKDPRRDVGPYMHGVSIDPLSNILSAMRYGISRYGSIPKAFDRPGGYDDGGEIYPGYTGIWNGLSHSETVVPLPPDLVNNLLKQGQRGGPVAQFGDVHLALPVDVDLLAQRLDHVVTTAGGM